MKKILKLVAGIIVIASVFLIGFFTGKSNRSYQIDAVADQIKRSITSPVSDALQLSGRKQVLLENPELIGRIMEGGSFGNDNFSVAAAQNMFSKDESAIQDIIDKTKIRQVAPGVWFIRMPIVNCTVIETADGLVLIDTGMKPAGPALLKAIHSISKKRINTIIYTHGHVDHCYGSWALIAAGENPEIIAQKNLKNRFERYMKLRGSIAKYMSQPADQLPKDASEFVWPTRYFEDELLLNIGGTKLELKHFKGETDDQLFVWLPEQKMLLAADYYRSFLPNAGNGKRVQRYVEDWVKALHAMMDLHPEILLPSHGKIIEGPKHIQENLLVLTEALETLVQQTLAGLNAGLRKDQIFQSVELPEHLRNHPLLTEKYVTAKGISKMILKQYTGWWDDVPSHWSPAPLELQAEKIVELAGGIDELLDFTRKLADEDLVLASHFTDWAYFADPRNPEVQRLVMDVYKRRIMLPQSVTQEMLAYLDFMAMVRQQMK